MKRIALQAGVVLAVAAASVQASEERVEHVLLLSIDGMHHRDLTAFIAAQPSSALATLARRGIIFSEARTPVPSDSFPGVLALATGGTPRSTGVYYDDSYDRTLFAPGSNCTGSPGTEIIYDESVDFDLSKLFSGGIDPGNLPLRKDARGCHRVFPHEFLRVNTIFEVVKAAGGKTAWSDKHPSYDLLNGPSGKGIDDLYTPEINSDIANGGTVNGVHLSDTKAQCDGSNSLPPKKVQVYTDCLPAVKAYDDVKAQAVVNLIEGKHADGSAWDGKAPALLGMNFQAVSVGEKLPVGGYLDGAGTPSANLADAIAHTDQSIGKMLAALRRRGLFDSTLVVISAKHGQSPIDRSTLKMEGGGHAPVQTVRDPIDFVNAADPNVDNVSFTNPATGNKYATGGHLQTDDVGILWLQNQSAANLSAVLAQLEGNAKAIFADSLPPDTIFSQSIVSGAALAAIFGEGQLAAARAPDVFIQPNAGVIYSGSSKKIAEHGGGTVDDTHVALLVAGPDIEARIVDEPVETAQVAPTILRALGLDPRDLEAVRKEHTRPLPQVSR